MLFIVCVCVFSTTIAVVVETNFKMNATCTMQCYKKFRIRNANGLSYNNYLKILNFSVRNDIDEQYLDQIKRNAHTIYMHINFMVNFHIFRCSVVVFGLNQWNEWPFLVFIYHPGMHLNHDDSREYLILFKFLVVNEHRLEW